MAEAAQRPGFPGWREGKGRKGKEGPPPRGAAPPHRVRQTPGAGEGSGTEGRRGQWRPAVSAGRRAGKGRSEPGAVREPVFPRRCSLRRGRVKSAVQPRYFILFSFNFRALRFDPTRAPPPGVTAALPQELRWGEHGAVPMNPPASSSHLPKDAGALPALEIHKETSYSVFSSPIYLKDDLFLL